MLSKLLDGFSALDQVFAGIAFAGTLFFLLRAGWLFLGGFGADLDHGHDPGVGSTTDTHDTDASFKLLSLNSLTALIMIFGWVGLACSRQFHWGEGAAILGASLAGVAAMAGTSLLLKLFLKLDHPGQCFRIAATVGKKGQVYLKIPGQGTGKVQVVVEGVSRELDAVSENHTEIPSFVVVEVVRAVDARTVAVARAL